MRGFLTLVVSLYAFTFGLASAKAIGLKETIGFALENSPGFDSAKRIQSIRDLEYQSAIAKILPSLDFATTNGLQNNIPISGNNALLTPNPSAPWYSSVTLGLTENLYDNGVSLTKVTIADLNRQLASISFLKARDSLTLDVAGEFYRFSLATALLEVRKQQQAILERQFKSLASQYQQGFKTKSDFLRLKAQVQRAEMDKVTAENRIELSAAELGRLIGVKSQDPQPPKFDAIGVNSDQPIEALTLAEPPSFEKIYDFRISKTQGEINSKQVLLTKRNYWPQVFVSSGISYSNLNYLNSNTPFNTNNQLSWNALVTLQFNFWDWGIRRRDVEIAQFNMDIQENGLSQTLLDSRAKINSMMADISRIRRSYKVSQELFTLEEESYHNLEAQYREGKVTYLDLITGLNNLLDAKVQFYTSYFDALQATARYRFFEGTIYETLVKN